MRANRGAPGVDAVTIADIEAAGVSEFLAGIEVALREGCYRPRLGIDGRVHPVRCGALPDAPASVAGRLARQMLPTP